MDTKRIVCSSNPTGRDDKSSNGSRRIATATITFLTYRRYLGMDTRMHLINPASVITRAGPVNLSRRLVTDDLHARRSFRRKFGGTADVRITERGFSLRMANST